MVTFNYIQLPTFLFIYLGVCFKVMITFLLLKRWLGMVYQNWSMEFARINSLFLKRIDKTTEISNQNVFDIWEPYMRQKEKLKI